MLSVFSHIIFGNSGRLFHPSGTVKAYNWRDKCIYFDLRPKDIRLTNGEQLICSFYPIEDVKGNENELGVLMITNLRLIWFCCKKPRANMSIGWRSVSICYERNIKDVLGSSSSRLFVLAKHEETKYEFIFNRYANISDDSPTSNNNASEQLLSPPVRGLIPHLTPMYIFDPFEVVYKVWMTYKSTALFRLCQTNIADILLRSRSYRGSDEEIENSSLEAPLVHEINLLESEESQKVFPNIMQSQIKPSMTRSFYVGILTLTNIRLVWVDGILGMRNISIPYIRITSLKLKSNENIVVTTYDCLSYSFSVEFKVKDSKKGDGKIVFDQMNRLYLLSKSYPRFGPESCENCIAYMKFLRPIENFFIYHSGKIAGPMIGNFEPIGGKSIDQEDQSSNQGTDMLAEVQQVNIEHDDNYDDGDDDSEMNNYCSKQADYLNEHPIDRDNELVLSQELGLAFERPADGSDIRHIWRIEVL